jgi:hypothetical protein
MHAVSRERGYVASTLRDLDSHGVASASGKRRMAVVSRPGVDVMISFVGRHDLLNDRQAESGPLF